MFDSRSPFRLVAEFGVYEGYSINHLARAVHLSIVHGFDSFVGLREDWPGTPYRPGTFDRGGKLPRVRKNVMLYPGWFDQTVPPFLAQNLEKLSVYHLDANKYEAISIDLRLVAPRITDETILMIDEFHGFPNWENGEKKALDDFCEEFGFQQTFLAFGPMQAAVKLSRD